MYRNRFYFLLLQIQYVALSSQHSSIIPEVRCQAMRRQQQQQHAPHSRDAWDRTREGVGGRSVDTSAVSQCSASIFPHMTPSPHGRIRSGGDLARCCLRKQLQLSWMTEAAPPARRSPVLAEQSRKNSTSGQTELVRGSLRLVRRTYWFGFALVFIGVERIIKLHIQCCVILSR